MPYKQTLEEGLKLFDEKLETYDKYGGFIVYLEDYDQKDFDTDLIKLFLTTFAEKIRESIINDIKVKNAPVIEEVNNRLKDK